MEIVGITYRAGATPILGGVSTELPEGRITALIGPNGAGKTTLIRCLAGELQPASGAVRVAGREIRLSSDEWKGEMGYVPDGDELFDELSVGEHLSLAATLFGIRGADQTERVDSLLALASLGERSATLGRELSAGMRKRLAIALALIHAPRILLFDEPLNSLDFAGGETFFKMLQFLRSAGRTVLVSGHSIPALVRVADRFVEIDGGRIVNVLDLPATGNDPDSVIRRLVTVPPAGAADDVSLSWMTR
ncbi:MAG TPA: ABC transporter ATP-binding protein [Spirochaetia bacterium]|nr:ABC transporter ATP-binding protein [Spirochaetia bacterium]